MISTDCTDRKWWVFIDVYDYISITIVPSYTGKYHSSVAVGIVTCVACTLVTIQTTTKACLSITYIAHPCHPYVESLLTLE